MNVLAERAKELVEREGIRSTKTKNTQVIIDGTNEAKIPGYPYIFESLGDKVLVSVDIFKSGYECKVCQGERKIEVRCSCDNTSNDRPGFKYTTSQLAEYPESQREARAAIQCSECSGGYLSKRQTITCSACNGTGGLLIMPDESKVLPSTGVIVSIGPEVENKNLKPGVRVLFGGYSGTMIPTKALGVAFKSLKEHELLTTIKGGEDMAAFEFIGVDRD